MAKRVIGWLLCVAALLAALSGTAVIAGETSAQTFL